MAQFKNCTIVVVVLAALLVIFLPFVFKGAPTEFTSLALPNRPSSPSPDQFNPGLSRASQSFTNPFTLPLAPGTAWVLPVADFKENSDANVLVHTLREKGFKAYARQITMSMGGSVTRVFVGPEIKLEQIKNVATRLNKEMQLKSAVTAFNPLLL